jgi:nucleotide-binding universal stress UspA family protein
MRGLDSILLATDFRPASQQAARVAARLASTFGSRVSLLHVLEPLPGWPVALHQEREQVTRPLRELAEELAAQKVEVAPAPVLIGPVALTIVRKAAEVDADLIVLGAGERSRFDRFTAGPVAEAVLEQAPQPVLAVRPGEPEPAFRTVLCPVDQSAVSARGLRNAIRLTRAFDGKLLVLTVVPALSWLAAAAETGQVREVAAEHERRWRAAFEEFLAGIPLEGVRWEREVRRGEPHEQIVAAAREHGADVLVLGATGRTGLVRLLLGSVTRRVLRQLPCSLLTVKEEDVIEELFQGDVSAIKGLMAKGRQLLAGGACEAALTQFGQVLLHNPFHVPALEARAEAHERLGQPELAAFYRRRAAFLQDEIGR